MLAHLLQSQMSRHSVIKYYKTCLNLTFLLKLWKHNTTIGKLKSLPEHEDSFIIVINFSTGSITLGLQVIKANIKVNGLS